MQISNDPFEGVVNVLGEILKNCALDENKWVEYLNSLPDNERELFMKFKTDDIEDGFCIKMNFKVTKIELTVADEIRSEIEKGELE